MATTRSSIASRVFAAAFPLAMALIVVVVALVLQTRGYRTISVGGAVLVALLSGLAAMVTVETVKRLLPLRGAYNSRQVGKWLTDRLNTDGAAMNQLVRAIGLDSNESPTGGVSRLRRVLRPGQFAEAFNLPVEQLSAQINAAIERVTRDPHAPADLLRTLCPGLDPTEFESLQRGRSTASPDTIATVAYNVSAAIDQLQIHLAGQWRHYLQATSWWLAGAFGLLLAGYHIVPGVGPIAATVISLTAGGFIAWFARDLTAVIEGLRR